VDKIVLEQIFPSTLVSPANSHSSDCCTLIIMPLGVDTVGQLVVKTSDGLSISPEKNKKVVSYYKSMWIYGLRMRKYYNLIQSAG
jgi:hypothetical protein